MRRTRRAPKFALSCGASRRAWYSDCAHESEIGSESESPRSLARWFTIVHCNAATHCQRAQRGRWLTGRLRLGVRLGVRRSVRVTRSRTARRRLGLPGPSPSGTSGDRDSESPTRTGAESWAQAPILDNFKFNPPASVPAPVARAGAPSRPRPGALEPDPLLTRRTNERGPGACHGHGPSHGASAR